jgi:hypothetical protein
LVEAEAVRTGEGDAEADNTGEAFRKDEAASLMLFGWFNKQNKNIPAHIKRDSFFNSAPPRHLIFYSLSILLLLSFLSIYFV